MAAGTPPLVVATCSAPAASPPPAAGQSQQSVSMGPSQACITHSWLRGSLDTSGGSVLLSTVCMLATVAEQVCEGLSLWSRQMVGAIC